MSQPFIGEVRLVGFTFGPQDWSLCQGQLIAISENSTLFNLIGTTYGGDGQNTFALPNLQSRVPVHQGPGYVMGQLGGVENVTITSATYPTHQHALVASSSSNGATSTPGGNLMAAGSKIYKNENPPNAMNPAMVSTAPGSNLPHNNIQPYQALNWIIALYGVYPSQS